MRTSGYSSADSKQGKQQELVFFVEALRAHCNDDTLIKGWEADRRICNGRQRAALRAAARDVRQKSFKNASRQAPAAGALSQVEQSYISAVQQLHEELAKAQESDFDSMLKDGLEWLEERLGLEDRSPKHVNASVFDRVGDRLLKKLTDQRASGHRGIAIERDLRHATVLHGVVSKAFEQMDDTDKSQLEYLQAIEDFADELAKAGEPDFDGKLRQGINFLQNGGKRLCY